MSMKKIYVNPTRRDLLKQLVASGAVATTLLSSPFASAAAVTDPFGIRSVWRDDNDYDRRRRASLWRSNAPARYPDVIVRAESEADVAEAIRFAAANDLQVVTRVSGHNASCAVLRNGGMMLDVSSLGGVSVNPNERTVDLEAGVRIGQLHRELDRYNLSFPSAECLSVGVAGYLLGGGIGANGRHWGGGAACYNVLEADVILATGEKVTARGSDDLLWAIRGAGPGFFGVITRLRLRVFDEPAAVLQSRYLFPVEATSRVMAALDQQRDVQDERVEIIVSIGDHPDFEDRLVTNLSVTSYADPGRRATAEARELLGPYAGAAVVNEAIGKAEYQETRIANMKFTTNPSDRHNQDNFNTDDASALVTMAELFGRKPPSANLTNLFLSYNRWVPPLSGDAAFSAEGRHYLGAILHWRDGDDDEAAALWFADFDSMQRPFAKSHCINDVNGAYPERMRASFSAENWSRLARLRRQYDPDNRFFTYLGHEATA